MVEGRVGLFLNSCDFWTLLVDTLRRMCVHLRLLMSRSAHLHFSGLEEVGLTEFFGLMHEVLIDGGCEGSPVSAMLVPLKYRLRDSHSRT